MKVSEIFDVDHMIKSRGINLPSVDNRDLLKRDFENYGNLQKWEAAVKRINRELLDDNAEFISSAGGKQVEINGKTFAVWSERNGNGHIDIRLARQHAVKESLSEGMFVVKNKDGKEKRFKDDSSPEAKAWKDSSSDKKSYWKKPEKYSDAWWDEQDWTGKYKGVMPDTKIVAGPEGISGEDLEKMDQAGIQSLEDFTISNHGRMVVGKTTCATADIRALVSYDAKEMGLKDSDSERIEEGVNLRVRRDEKNPSKFVFVKFL